VVRLNLVACHVLTVPPPGWSDREIVSVILARQPGTMGARRDRMDQ
jgi:hypothetical protein